MPDAADSPHLSEAEVAALIYAVGQNRDLERRAYSHLAICAECTRLIGSVRDADRDTSGLLSTLDVAVPTRSVESVIRAAQKEQRHVAFGGRRAAAVVAILVVGAAVAAAAVPASPVHRLLVAMLESTGGISVHAGFGRVPPAESVSPAVSFVTAPNSALEIAFDGSAVGGGLEVRVVDGDEVSVSSPSSGATYRVSTNRIAVEQSEPGQFQLQVPRSLGELRVRVGNVVVFDRRPVVAGPSNSFTIQLTRPNASR